ncbi:NHL repeat-containing protein [Winogradskyella immobilis]|uniref:Uncharacterized protein n=1 Tax=Winogradskyella immobilis TaxID=2816852 RepID=A0ABS8EKE6_9FLAO|nr:hypothetical protein [Winogradskyella immobilis]MCC1483700.1 hypothetical protein [Winogradskyella immobilis]MCG0015794.1 hypothetical protein [Winogradskyella immobilis]
MKQLLTITICLIALISFSQTTSLSVMESKEFKDDVKSNKILALHTTEIGVTAVVRDSKKNLLFDLFDKDLNKTYSKLIEISKKESYLGDLFYGDELKLFTLFKENKFDRKIACHVFNLKDKTHKKIELFSATVDKNQALFSGSSKRETGFALSPDGGSLVIATDNIKKNSNSYTVRVFNANTLELEYKKSYQESTEKFFEPNDIAIDNSKNVYVVGKLFLEGKAKKKKDKANYKFILNKISESKVDNLEIKLETEFISSLNINRSDQLKLYGFYSDKRDGRIKGGCSFVIDENTLNVINKNKNVLPKSVYDDLYGYRKANKKEGKELSSFYLDHILEDNQGNSYLIAEEFYITTQYVSNGAGGGYWTTVYHYNDILILKFTSKGNLEWGRSIFKRSTSPSYNVFLKNDELHVILNSGKNLTEKKDGRTKVSKGWFESSALYDFAYDVLGEVSYNKIQDNKGKTFYLPFYGAYQGDRYIMVSSGRKKKQFMSLQ